MGRQPCRRARRGPSTDGSSRPPISPASPVRAFVAVSREYYRVVVLSLLRNGLDWDVQATNPAMLVAAARRDPTCVCVVDVAYCLEAPGESICAQLRRVSSSPLLVMGSHADEDRALRCLDDGADAYLLWPFEPQQLVALAHALWRRASGELQEMQDNGA